MITLELFDGRKLTFEVNTEVLAQPAPSYEHLDIISITYNDFIESFAPKSGPDFILTSRRDTNLVHVVEIKTGRIKSPIKQLADETILRAIHSAGFEINLGPNLNIHRQLWSVNLNKHLISVYDVGNDGALGTKTIYSLTQVENSKNLELNTDSIVDQQDSVSTESLLMRIVNWEERLRALYETISIWALEVDQSFVVDNASTVLMDEELMRRYAIKSRQLPVLLIKKDGKIVATLKPYGLWTIGSNGRIDLYSSTLNGFIVDRSKPFSPPVWQLYGSSDRKLAGKKIRDGVSFDKDALQLILGA